MALMVVLTRFYPSYVIHIQLLMILDIASHWIHMYRSVALIPSAHIDGCSAARSSRVTRATRPSICRLTGCSAGTTPAAYGRLLATLNTFMLTRPAQPVLFTMCAANEVFFMAAYINHFTAGPLCKTPLE